MAPFFNHKVRTMTLLVRLARKHDATVLLTWAERLHQGKGYKLNLKKINVVSEENTLESDVGLMNHEIENLIKTNPEQYLFNYKRFKSILKY
jgi:KDO2-lipid IV(A) lauroyltransferase